MKIDIKFFATYRDVIGKADMTLSVEDTATIATIMEYLEQQYPQLAGRLSKHALVAVNEQYVHHQQPLQANDVIALFPPVSGG